ncbi:MAG: PorT family protein [Cloacibacterium sp.]|nr:PorT family protein [Cloacibacterium sp.]
MRKIILTLMILQSIIGFAQKKKVITKKTNNFHFGIKAGGNYSNIAGKDIYYTYRYRFGFHGGLVGKYDFGNQFSAQAEVLYSNIGTKTEFYENNYKFNGIVKIQNITIPIVVQYKIIPKLYVETGPEVNINLTAIHKEEKGENWSFDWKKYMSSSYFAWAIGSGFHITDELSINARYSLGIITPFKKIEGSVVDHFKMNNVQLGLIYFIK